LSVGFDRLLARDLVKRNWRGSHEERFGAATPTTALEAPDDLEGLLHCSRN